MTGNSKILKVSETIRANPLIDFAYLFGSRAKNIAGERSDWDIAVHFNKNPQKLPRWTAFYLEAEISREIGGEVQITVLNNLDSPVFLFQIISDGLLLADNDTEKRIIFEANVLRRYHDWNYILKRQMKSNSF